MIPQFVIWIELLKARIFYKKLHTSSLLAAIYDSIGDFEKKNYYNGFVSEMALDRIDDESERSEIQEIYLSYKDEIQRINNVNKKKKMIMIAIPVLIIIVVLIIFVIYKSRKHSIVISNIIKEKEDVIQDMKFKHSLVEGKIRKKNSELQKQADLIKQQEQEIEEIRSKLEKEDGFYDLKSYYQSDICIKIYDAVKINEQNDSDESGTILLTKEEFALLLQSANLHLKNKINKISNEFPKLKKKDLFYLCLVLLNLNDKQIAALFGVTYNTIWGRRNKICSILSINNAELNNFLSTKYL